MALLPIAAAIAVGGAAAQAGEPEICRREDRHEFGHRARARRRRRILPLRRGPDLRSARCLCVLGGYLLRRARALRGDARSVEPLPGRFIVFPAPGTGLKELGAQLEPRLSHPQYRDRGPLPGCVLFARDLHGADCCRTLANPKIEYAEPDCDGPDFLTTSIELFERRHRLTELLATRGASSAFRTIPASMICGATRKIGWNSDVAARSLPRIVAVLDSGIDAAHEDLTSNVMINRGCRRAPRERRAAASTRVAPPAVAVIRTARKWPAPSADGWTMASAWPASHPNSLLLPIVISRVDHGLLARLSTIAEGIDAAVRGGADVINISAKWPVDSRAISEAIYAAVGGDSARRRLVVTGYATSLERDESVREYFPSRYRCLPGVLAAVPTDMRGRDLFNPAGTSKCDRRPDSGTWRGHRGDDDREFRARLRAVRGSRRFERRRLRFRRSSPGLGQPAAEQMRRPADKTIAVLQEQDAASHRGIHGSMSISSVNLANSTPALTAAPPWRRSAAANYPHAGVTPVSGLSADEIEKIVAAALDRRPAGGIAHAGGAAAGRARGAAFWRVSSLDRRRRSDPGNPARGGRARARAHHRRSPQGVRIRRGDRAQHGAELRRARCCASRRWWIPSSSTSWRRTWRWSRAICPSRTTGSWRRPSWHCSMNYLPNATGRCLVRFYLDGTDKQQLCQELGLSPKHFDRVLMRARTRLRTIIERRAPHLALFPRITSVLLPLAISFTFWVRDFGFW